MWYIYIAIQEKIVIMASTNLIADLNNEIPFNLVNKEILRK